MGLKGKIIACVSAILGLLLGVGILESRRRRAESNVIKGRIQVRRQQAENDMKEASAAKFAAMTETKKLKQEVMLNEERLRKLDESLASRKSRRDALLAKLDRSRQPVDPESE